MAINAVIKHVHQPKEEVFLILVQKVLTVLPIIKHTIFGTITNN